MSASVTKRNAWLDVVRGLAIVAVIVVHSGHSARSILGANGMHLSNKIVEFTDLGAAGVELFFFISGWLLASIYGDVTKPLGRAYWLRRIGRIIPLWLLFLGVAIAVSGFSWATRWNEALKGVAGEPAWMHDQTWAVILTATFTLWISSGLWNTVIGGGWSIQAEVGHYLVFPALRKFSLRNILRILAAVNLVTLGLVSIAGSLKSHRTIFLAVEAWLRLDLYATIGFFILGLITYRVWAKTQEGKTIGESLAALQVDATTAVIYTLTFMAVPLAYSHTLNALGFVVASLALSYGAYKVNWAAKVFATIGKYSYFIYFCHFIVLDIVRYYGKTKLHLAGPESVMQFVVLFGVFALALGVSIALAVPSFKFFEKPMMRLARRFE